jgi:hypothetical protein
MKKQELYRLTLLGLTTGLTMLGQNNLNGFEDSSSQDMQNFLAKPSCKASDGCGAPGEDSEEDKEEDQNKTKKNNSSNKNDTSHKV